VTVHSNPDSPAWRWTRITGSAVDTTRLSREAMNRARPVMATAQMAREVTLSEEASGSWAADPVPLDAEPLDAEPLDAEPLDAEPLDAVPLEPAPPPTLAGATSGPIGAVLRRPLLRANRRPRDETAPDGPPVPSL